jgi:hypothetical protein
MEFAKAHEIPHEIIFKVQIPVIETTLFRDILVEPPSLTVWSPRSFIYGQHITPASYNGDRFFQLFKAAQQRFLLSAGPA